nr:MULTISPECIES: IS110 family transposase [unclassified Thioalkalivibrio]
MSFGVGSCLEVTAMDTPLLVAVDVGSRFHQVAVGDGTGHVLDEFRIDHEPSGFTAFFERVERHRRSPDQRVQVAMEGYNGWARPLDSQTLARGWALYNVNNLKLARYKEIFPAPAKTDAIDSRRMLELFALDQQPGVARNALQRVTLIPKAHRHLKYLTRRRRVLVQERAGRLTRLNCDLQALCPGLLSITGSIDNRWFLRFLTCRDRLTALPRVRASTLLRIRGIGRAYLAKIQAWQPTAQFGPDIAFGDMDVVTDARSILTLSERITELDTELERLACESQPARLLRSIPGFGPTGVAELVGEIGTLDRFTKESGLAVYVGMAPLANSSGVRDRGKRPRSVNTRCQNALMTCVARHMAHVPESRAYYDRKRAQGKTHNQAVRALGRHLIRMIWTMLRQGREYHRLPTFETPKP